MPTLNVRFFLWWGNRSTKMFEAFFKDKLGPLTLRVAVGLACVYHGYVKIMVAGGTAWAPELPVGWQLFIAWGELAAGLAILFGFWCRLAAALAVALTAGTVVWWQGWHVFHLPLPRLEPVLLLLLMGLALLFLGAGGLSLDGRGGGKGLLSRAGKKR
jgi:uncharacterized membrane protein YphA (DoxX/SURF4 family)